MYIIFLLLLNSPPKRFCYLIVLGNKSYSNFLAWSKCCSFLCLLCRHICRRVSSILGDQYMYTEILISEVFVFRTFTSMPINGLNINFQPVTSGFEFHRVLLNAAVSKFLSKVEVFGTSDFLRYHDKIA